MTLDLASPSTHQLLRRSPSYSGPNMSFDMPASLEYLSGLARASLAESRGMKFKLWTTERFLKDHKMEYNQDQCYDDPFYSDEENFEAMDYEDAHLGMFSEKSLKLYF
ncbi:hypothetical protein Tco_1546350 [Tanacetum coccineum]